MSARSESQRREQTADLCVTTSLSSVEWCDSREISSSCTTVEPCAASSVETKNLPSSFLRTTAAAS